MNYTSQYNRANFSVIHPHLEKVNFKQDIHNQRAGRKRFDAHKNEESSGLSYGYSLSNTLEKKTKNEIEGKTRSQPNQNELEKPNYYLLNDLPRHKFESNFEAYLSQKANDPEPSLKKNNQNEGTYERKNQESYRDEQRYSNSHEVQYSTENAVPKYHDQSIYVDIPYQKYPETNNQQYDPQLINEYNQTRDLTEENKSRNKEQAVSNSQIVENVINKYESNENPEFFDEIEKLKEELRKKEEELSSYQQKLLNKSESPVKEEEQAIYSRINKALFDKQRAEESKKFTSMTLESQLSEKAKSRSLEIMQKEKEQALRLEMLKKLREDEARERYEKLMRAKEYREQLEIQNLVKNNLDFQEKAIFKSDVPKPRESPSMFPESVSRSNHSVQSFSPITQKFTKKAPKTICYNPITGVLKDTSQYVIGAFPSYNVKDPSITYLKNQSNIPELAAHPAFQQQKFTKNHPKIVHSFPVTGGGLEITNPDYKKNPSEENITHDKLLADYGALMLQTKNPAFP